VLKISFSISTNTNNTILFKGVFLTNIHLLRILTEVH